MWWWQAIAVGSEAIGNMCRSIAAWAKQVGKAKLEVENDDIQPIVDSIQASALLGIQLVFIRICYLLFAIHWHNYMCVYHSL